MDTDQADGLPLAEAARRLGISENALRKRVRRGTITAARGADGRWYVYFSNATGLAEGPARAGDPDAGAHEARPGPAGSRSPSASRPWADAPRPQRRRPLWWAARWAPQGT